MRIPDLIEKKRDGGALEDDEIRYFIDQLVIGTLEHSQLGAMLMAWFLNGMTARELAVLTQAMTTSGDTLKWPEEWRPVLVDKHSTGGVGDKVSLVLAPALAACGLKVPMVSGRGLGHSGGTLDKLESIPGYKVSISQEEMLECLSVCGCCIAGQTTSLVPADRLMYATRDITATVANRNLVTASIISKKAAENISVLVLDVKVGRGSFQANIEEGRLLAQTLVSAARDVGMKTTAALTAMDTPIGMTIGNSLEVIEAVEALRGQGPADLIELVTVEGGLILQSMGRVEDLQQGIQQLLLENLGQRIKDTLQNGTALDRFEKMLVCQNVDEAVARELCRGDVRKVLPRAQSVTPLLTAVSGRVADIDALSLAQVTGACGAARARADDVIRPAVGMQLKVTVGQAVEAGQVWAELHHEGNVAPGFLAKLDMAITITPGSAAVEQLPMPSRILELIQ